MHTGSDRTLFLPGGGSSGHALQQHAPGVLQWAQGIPDVFEHGLFRRHPFAPVHRLLGVSADRRRRHDRGQMPRRQKINIIPACVRTWSSASSRPTAPRKCGLLFIKVDHICVERAGSQKQFFRVSPLPQGGACLVAAGPRREARPGAGDQMGARCVCRPHQATLDQQQRRGGLAGDQPVVLEAIAAAVCARGPAWSRGPHGSQVFLQAPPGRA